MARDKMLDPDFQKAFTEVIHKEKDTRMKWHVKYGVHHKPSGLVKWDEDPDSGDGDKEIFCAHNPPNNVLKMPSVQERAWPRSRISPTRTIPRVEHPPKVMKPVPRNSREILYHGISHDGEGRSMYLKYRARKTPMEKYHFPLVNSWAYGWNTAQDSYCPKHGKH